jgi:uncharacterized protein (TIGR02186 family)
MTGKRGIKLLICLIGIASLVCAISVAGESQTRLEVVPDEIQIGTFYDGCTVHVSATTSQCDGAVIVLEGQDEEVTLNRKGRVAFIWMNVARITISGLPQAYIMAASDKLENICSGATLRDLRLGLQSLRPRMKVSSDRPLTGGEFEQFLKLKEHSGAYDTDIKINLKTISPDSQELSADLPIPSRMPPGTYDINLYCFRDGNLIENQVGRLGIETIGLPCLLMNLADKHAAMYGLLAIIVAMVAGLVIGIIFSALPGNRRRY